MSLCNQVLNIKTNQSILLFFYNQSVTEPQILDQFSSLKGVEIFKSLFNRMSYLKYVLLKYFFYTEENCQDLFGILYELLF